MWKGILLAAVAEFVSSFANAATSVFRRKGHRKTKGRKSVRIPSASGQAIDLEEKKAGSTAIFSSADPQGKQHDVP